MLTYALFAQTGVPFGSYNARLSWPSTFKSPTVPSIIAMKLSATATKLHLVYKPLGSPFDKLSSWMKWLGYWGRLRPCLERSKNEVSSWHTGGRKTSNHGWTRGWESRLRGRHPWEASRGWGVGEIGQWGSGRALISTEGTTKLELFTLKRKEIAFFPLDAFSSWASCP